jgi:hypothetical protein
MRSLQNRPYDINLSIAATVDDEETDREACVGRGRSGNPVHLTYLLLPSCLLRLKPLSKPQYHGEAEIKLGLGGSHVTKHTQSGLMIKI